MINAPVLVLNQNYEPLNVCDIRRAFRLLGAEKAELLERNHQVIHTPTLAIDAPSVIRLQYHVKRPRPRVKLSRREIFARDRHTCQYCGTVSRDLTIDHVDTQASRRPPRMGEPGRGVSRLQPSQGQQDADRGAHEPAPRAPRAPRRRALPLRHVPQPTSATTPGAATSS